MPVITTRRRKHNNTEGTEMQKKKKKWQHTANPQGTFPFFFFSRVKVSQHTIHGRNNVTRAKNGGKNSCKVFLPEKVQSSMQSLRADTKYMFLAIIAVYWSFFFFPQKETRTSFQQFLLEEVHRKKNLHNLTPRVLTQQAAYISHSANAINAKRSVAAKQSNAVCCRGRPSLGFSGKQLLRINIWLRSSTINSSP